MTKCRILLAEDTVIIRKMTEKLLLKQTDFEIAGSVANGQEALEAIEASVPDIVVLDVEMPVMDGIEALAEIKRRWPTLPVIMFSTLTQKGAQTTFKALARGASEFVGKPSHSGGAGSLSLSQVEEELVEKIRALTKKAPTATQTPRPKLSKEPPQPPPGPALTHRPAVVAIGSSTGGPGALSSILEGLGTPPSAPILIAQHMPAVFTRVLAESLSSKSGLKVVEAEQGMPLEAGTVYIAPGDYHLVADQKPILRLTQTEKRKSCRPAADELFESVARHFGTAALAIVLTGMGDDGTDGASAVKQAGGSVWAQDEASSVIWGMPGSIVQHGLADAVLSLEQVPQRLQECLRLPRHPEVRRASA